MCETGSFDHAVNCLAAKFPTSQGDDPPQQVTRGVRVVDPEIGSAGTPVSGFGDEIHDAFGPFSVGIGEMAHLHPKEIFQKFLAGEDLFAGFCGAEFGEVSVGEAVGPDLMSRRKPLPDLQSVHQRDLRIAVDAVPDIRFPDQAGDKELDRPEALTLQMRQGVHKDIPTPVVEGQDNLFPRLVLERMRRKVIKRSCGKAGLPETGKLCRKISRGDKQKGIPSAARGVADAMVGQDRRAFGKKSPLGRSEKDLWKHPSNHPLILVRHPELAMPLPEAVHYRSADGCRPPQ